jgi:hypothetical protein
MDIRAHSEAAIGRTWTAEDAAELVRWLAEIDQLVADIVRIKVSP